MKAAFEDGRLKRGRFTEKTSQNLQERRCVSWYFSGCMLNLPLVIRELIDEICVWATARLVRLVTKWVPYGL
jgi:hypothetical protein